MFRAGDDAKGPKADLVLKRPLPSPPNCAHNPNPVPVVLSAIDELFARLKPYDVTKPCNLVGARPDENIG